MKDLSRRRLLRLQAPELKTRFVNGFFDRRTGKTVRRILVVADHAGGVPGGVLARQLAAGGIAREGLQSAAGLRLENENPQNLSPLAPRPRRAPGGRSELTKLVTYGRTPADTGALVLVAEDEAARVGIIGRHLAGYPI